MAGQNTPIIAIDYNNLQSLVSSILGAGSANYGYDPDDTSDFGYGQPVSSSSILPGNIITATHWNNLRSDILKCRQHQTGLNMAGSLPPVTTSSIITESYRSNLSSMLTDAAQDANRLITPPDGSAPNTTAQGTRVDLIPAQQRTTIWNNNIVQTVTVTFPTPNAARYFFNTGSQLEITASRSGGTVSGTMGAKNAAWTAMLAGMGTVTFSAHATNRSGSSGTAQTQVGWYEVGTTDREIFQQQDPTPNSSYSANRYLIKVRTNSQRSQLIFTIEFKDSATGQVDDNVDGTLISRMQMYYATGSNVSVTPPTATSTPITLGGAPIITTYSIVPNITLINTGTSVIYTVNTSNVAAGTVLYWENTGTTVSSNFTDNTNTGTVTVDLDNVVTFTRTLKNDFSVDPNMTIVMKLSTTLGGSAVATATPVALRQPTFAITPNVTTIVKGNTVTYNIVTSNYGSGTLYWSTSGAGISTSTFADVPTGLMQGTITVTNNAAVLTRPLATDFLEEADKSFVITLKIGSQSGTTIATAAAVTIKSPSYQITHNIPSPYTIQEGSSATFTVNTSNVTNGTILYWTTLGSQTLTTSDFTDNKLNGSVTINNNTGSIVRGIAVDASQAPWYATTYPPSWGSFMNSYAVWKDTQFIAGTKTGAFTINFPQAGTYTVEYSGDNEYSWNLVSPTNVVVSSATGASNYTTSALKAVTITTPGSYTLNMSVTNLGTSAPGNPGGIAIRILRPVPSSDTSVVISVIDEASTPTSQQLVNDWTAFRTNYPNRKFCLMWPQNPGAIDGDSLSDLKIPAALNTDPNKVISTVNRDNGNSASKSDWFALCGLGSLPSGSQVFLTVDQSGSMTTATVQASYEYFKTRVAQAGLILIEQNMVAENWIAPLNTPSELTSTRIFAVQVPTEADEQFQLQLRLGSTSGTVLKTSANPIIIQEPPQIKVLSITNLYTSWGPDSQTGYHAITFDWTAGYVDGQGQNVITSSGHVSNDIHISAVINQYGYDGSYANSLVGKLLSDTAVSNYLFVGKQGNASNQASPMDGQGRWPNTTIVKVHP